MTDWALNILLAAVLTYGPALLVGLAIRETLKHGRELPRHPEPRPNPGRKET